MINLEHNLTVDDLIVEYMMYKVKNGYEPQFLTSEFMKFLRFFEKKMPIQDVLYEKEKLFQRFLKEKLKMIGKQNRIWICYIVKMIRIML